MVIKNMIFDLGGVILNINQDLMVEAFKKLGARNFDALYARFKQESFLNNFESGKTSVETFRIKVKKYLPINISNNEIDNAWNAMLLDLPQARIDLLLSLSNKYRLFLLSNTNPIHLTAYSKMLYNTYGFHTLLHIFEKEYYSHKVGLRKPDKEIFELLLKENHLRAEETLFIDDTLQHIEGANKLGIQSYWLDGEKTILDIPDIVQSIHD